MATARVADAAAEACAGSGALHARSLETVQMQESTPLEALSMLAWTECEGESIGAETSVGAQAKPAEELAPVAAHAPTLLSDEQRRRIEANRQLALARKRSREEAATSRPLDRSLPLATRLSALAQPPPPPAIELSPELREQIAARRAEAAARKRQRQEIERQRQAMTERSNLVARLGPLRAGWTASSAYLLNLPLQPASSACSGPLPWPQPISQRLC